MIKRLIIVYTTVILVCSLCSCARIAEDTLAAETEAVEIECRKIEDTEATDVENTEKLVAEEEHGQNEEEAEPIADEPEEHDVEKIDSISQLNVIGRTQEETNLIKEILSGHKEEFETFLMEDWEYPHIQWWVGVSGYDFTGDGEEEIIVSKFF